MSRYFLDIAYKGANYKGLQIQKNAVSVQGTIDTALSTILNTAIVTTCSSRTDAGVHAKKNFLHFDTEEIIPTDFIHRINLFLPKDILIDKIIPVHEDAHARFDAIQRTYEYYVHFKKDPFLEKTGFYYRFGELDINKMNKAAELLLSYEDYTSFCRAKTDVKTKICSISKAEWKVKVNHGGIPDTKVIVFKIAANRFLRGMVRGIVGTLIQVGNGKISISNFEDIVYKKNPRLTDFSPPPQGLFLTDVIYPYFK